MQHLLAEIDCETTTPAALESELRAAVGVYLERHAEWSRAVADRANLVDAFGSSRSASSSSSNDSNADEDAADAAAEHQHDIQIRVAPETIGKLIRWLALHSPQSEESMVTSNSAPQPSGAVPPTTPPPTAATSTRLVASIRSQRLIAQLVELWIDIHGDDVVKIVAPTGAAGGARSAKSAPFTRYESFSALLGELVDLLRFPGPCVCAMQCATKLLSAVVPATTNKVDDVPVESVASVVLRESASAATVYQRTPIAKLMPKLSAANAVVCSDAWTVLRALLMADSAAPAACSFVTVHAEPFLTGIIAVLRSSNYIAVRQTLHCLSSLVAQPQYSKARSKFLDSPALLWAIMVCAAGDPSHNIRYEAYHVIKVFLAKPTKVLPVRHLIFSNRENFSRYLTTFATGDESMDAQINDERPVLLKRVLAVQPLTREELVLLTGEKGGVTASTAVAGTAAS